MSAGVHPEGKFSSRESQVLILHGEGEKVLVRSMYVDNIRYIFTKHISYQDPPVGVSIYSPLYSCDLGCPLTTPVYGPGIWWVFFRPCVGFPDSPPSGQSQGRGPVEPIGLR